ncbi:MAG TPA: response regulator [Gemmataceae bacterium]|nr:response regulator [Gemmataceae bacterium]
MNAVPEPARSPKEAAPVAAEAQLHQAAHDQLEAVENEPHQTKDNPQTVWPPLTAVAAPAGADGDGVSVDRQPLKIVLVEDDADSRRMLETMLRLRGHAVRTARDGEEGLAAILADRPAVAVVDVGLPALDGCEVARRVRQAQDGKAVYLVALTGYGQTEDRKRVFDAGFDEHLVKPLKRGELEQVLDRVRRRP